MIRLSKLWQWAREYGGVAVFLSVILVVSLWVVRDNQQQRATETRQREIIATLAEQNNDAIQANGDFQTCVWTSIVKAKHLGNQKRSARAIRACDRKYLS